MSEEEGKTKMLKDLMGTLNPAEMGKVNQLISVLGAIMEVLPPIEVKPHYIRTFIDENKKEVKKEYIAIFIEKLPKAAKP